ncbi:MAG: 30S ribosomal protein S17 [Candidatus Omnitrophota bacterium]
MPEQRNKRKIRTGTVISAKMAKTIIVRTTISQVHPRYNRIITKHKKFKVHDEKNEAKVGDKVRIMETRPISKEKRFRLIEIIK